MASPIPAKVPLATPVPQIKTKATKASSSVFFAVQNDFQSELEKAFGGEAPQVIQGLRDFAKQCIENAAEDVSKEPLAHFFRSFDFPTVGGRVRVQLRAGADPHTKATYNAMVTHLKRVANLYLKPINEKIAKKDGLKYLLNFGALLVVGLAVAAAIFGGYAALPLGMYISLGVAALVALGLGRTYFLYRSAKQSCAEAAKSQLLSAQDKILDDLGILAEAYGVSFDPSDAVGQPSFMKYLQESKAGTAEAQVSHFLKQALWRDILLDGLWDQLSFAVRQTDAPRCKALLNALKSINNNLEHLGIELRSMYSKSNLEREVVWFEAVKQGDAEVCQAFIAAGIDIHARDYHDSVTALYYAAKAGQQQICKLLLQNGGCAGLPDADGRTAWHYLARTGDIEIGQLLLKVWNLNLMATGSTGSDYHGFSLLHHAIEARNKEMCHVLIGTSVDQECSQRQTLLKQIVDKKQRTPLDLALEIESGFPQDERIFSFSTALTKWWSDNLLAAMQKGDVALCRRLLAGGPDVNSIGSATYSYPLHLAARQGKIDIVRLLLEHGANVNGVDCLGRTPLHFAARAGNLEVVKLLVIEHKVDVGAKKDHSGLTPLHYAARDMCKNNFDESIADFLIASGADVNAKDEGNRDALHYVVAAYHKQIIVDSAPNRVTCGFLCQILLKNRAQAFGEHRSSSYWYLFDQDGILRARKELCQIFIEAGGFAVNAKDKEGRTVLQVLSEYVPQTEWEGQNKKDLLDLFVQMGGQ